MWKTPFNAVQTPGQTFTEPSKTLQGQTMSIADMLIRVNNGMPLSMSNLEYLDDDEPLPIIKDLTDLDDIQSNLNTFNERRKQLELDFAAKSKTKEKAKQENTQDS